VTAGQQAQVKRQEGQNHIRQIEALGFTVTITKAT
jgi:hypothetical protein